MSFAVQRSRRVQRFAVVLPSAALAIVLSGCSSAQDSANDAGKGRMPSRSGSAQREREDAARARDDDAGRERPSDGGRDQDGGVDGGHALDGGTDAGRQRDSGAERERMRDAASDGGKDASVMRDAGCTEKVDQPRPATFWLLIDGSGSLLSPLSASDSATRWDGLKKALLDPDQGVIKRLERDVQWGVLMYDGPSQGGQSVIQLPDGGVMTIGEPTTLCPRIVTVPPMLDNHAAIAQTLTDPLGGSTPTDKALEALIAQLPSDPGELSRTTIVLATDGEPNDFCSDAGVLTTFPTPVDVRPLVVDAVARAAARNVETYVINLAGDDQNLRAHLDDVAAAGNTGKASFAISDSAALIAALQEIVASGRAASCP